MTTATGLTRLGVMRRLIAVGLFLMAACSSSLTPQPEYSPSLAVSPAPAVADLVHVASLIYPFQNGRYVTCDNGYGGPSRYSQCPITSRLDHRLTTVFAGYISGPEPLGGGQDPEWQTESITGDPDGAGGIAHVVLTKPASASSKYDLVIILSEGQLLVDDLYCTGAERAKSSIYVDGWMNRFGC